ncbi:hypothetical protein Glove_138g19 [Diversispora epigaea]|uniref:Transmembrane protein n=1 Tax=Diversispora epigaea TaxID=1348612 RepID=A0A397J5B8_9GLOM|nr:hypothetical protein Glove_138g19 [Diversispora epigaea]
MFSSTFFELYQDFLDSIFFQRIFGWLISICLNLFLIIKKKDRFDNSNNMNQVEMFCLILSVLNTIYVWTKQKKYRFFGRDLLQRPKVANARLIDINLPYLAQNMFGDYMIRKFYEVSADLQYRGEYVWQVSVWDPNEFTLNLHCGISPVHIGIIILMQPDYWIYYIGLLILLTFQMYININKYASLVKDRQAIYGEVQRVYDAKFVNGKNKVPIMKQSISTQTNAFDAFDINMAQTDQEMNQLFMNFRDIDPWANDSTNSSTVD